MELALGINVKICMRNSLEWPVLSSLSFVRGSGYNWF